jgi:hypothetical protein
MCDWLNLGLQDPTVMGSNNPLLAANSPNRSWFEFRTQDGSNSSSRGFPRFVTTRGGAYTFLPSITEIRFLSKS